MNQLEAHNPQAIPGELDRILATEPELAPTSGFLAGVMDRVRAEAVAPAPIAFPWRRILPGALAAAAGALVAGYEAAHLLLPALMAWLHNPAPAQISALDLSNYNAGLAVAAVATLLSVVLAARIVRRA